MEALTIYQWLILPLLILGARIVETALKTIRQAYISRGFKYLAAAVGTGEISVWLLSTGIVFLNLANPLCILAYISGYAVGTAFGIELENRIKLGYVVVRIIVKGNPYPMILDLREEGFGITHLEGKGSYGSNVAVLLVISPRAKVDRLMKILKMKYPETIFSIEDIRYIGDRASLFYKDSGRRLLDLFAK